MARGKKKEELTLEEKLEQALVPVEEQPYEVPGNWCWIHLLDAFDNVTDSKKKLTTKEYLVEGEYPVIDQGQEFVGGYTDNKDVVYEGELPIVIFGDHTRCVKYIDFFFVQGADGVKVLRPKSFWNAKAFYYALQSIEIPNMGYRRHYPLFKDFGIPIPPLAEQQRIVEQIESLFAKLDEVKEKVQEVIASIDDNVEALLYKAFTGQLTNDWRNSNIEIEKWEDTTLSEIVSGLKYGSSEKSDYEYKGTPILRIPNIGDGIIDFSDLKYMSEELKNSSHEVFEDDILIIRSNGSRDLVGKCALVPKLQERYAYASFLIRVKVTEKVLPEYLVRFINSSMARAQMFDKAKSSSGIHNINSKELGAIKICAPSIKEQKQILICIQEFVNKEKRVQEISEEMLGSIDRMKKSILAKAFRGELGTNNPDEESAIELLKTMLVEA